MISGKRPNGSRLSCGRRTHRRKALEPLGRFGGGGNAIVPYWRAPDSFKRMLGVTAATSLNLRARDEPKARQAPRETAGRSGAARSASNFACAERDSSYL